MGATDDVAMLPERPHDGGGLARAPGAEINRDHEGRVESGERPKNRSMRSRMSF